MERQGRRRHRPQLHGLHPRHHSLSYREHGAADYHHYPTTTTTTLVSMIRLAWQSTTSIPPWSLPLLQFSGSVFLLSFLSLGFGQSSTPSAENWKASGSVNREARGFDQSMPPCCFCVTSFVSYNLSSERKHSEMPDDRFAFAVLCVHASVFSKSLLTCGCYCQDCEFLC
jgi:hypothetical protein